MIIPKQNTVGQTVFLASRFLCETLKCNGSNIDRISCKALENFTKHMIGLVVEHVIGDPQLFGC